MARALNRSGEAALAFVVLDQLVERFPRSSEILVERASARHSAGHEGFAQDLISASRGDLKSVDLVTVVTRALELMDAAQFAELGSAVAALSDGVSTDADIASAREIIRLAALVHAGTPLDLAADRPALADRAVTAFVALARARLDWEEIARIEEYVDVCEGGGQRFDRASLELANALRAKGDLTHSIELAQRVFARSGLPRARLIMDQSTRELEVRRDGWPVPMRAPRRSPEPGRLAYLLHSSLPYSSSGYATRSHGLMSSMQRQGWSVNAITRPVYPVDQEGFGHLKRSAVKGGDVIDGIPYSRLLTRPQRPVIDERIHHFANSVAAHPSSSSWGVVHAASNYLVGLAGVEAAARLGVPSIYEVRGMWDITRMSSEPEYEGTERFQMALRLEADACRHSDHAFAITEGLRSLMIERGVPADHISLLPNGVDVARFAPQQPNEELRDSLGLQGKTVIGYVGSVVDYEGLELLVDAVNILVSKKMPVALMIVGDGKVFESVKARVTEHGLWEHVVMPGRVPHAEAEAYYSIIDIAPFPRLPLPVTELVSPLKPFEAMAMAKPVVVSSVAALTEIVDDGSNGRVFTKGDVDSLVDTLAELIDDPEQRERLGSDARDWVVANRSWDALSERIVAVYEKLGVPAPGAAH